MNESIFNYREEHYDNTRMCYWERKNINTQLIRNSLLTLNLVGITTYSPDNAHLLNKKDECWCFYLVMQGKGSFRQHHQTVFFAPGDLIVRAPQIVDVTFNISSPFLLLKSLKIRNSIGMWSLCSQNIQNISVFHPLVFEKLVSLHENIMESMEKQSTDIECSVLQKVFAFLYETEHHCFAMEYLDPIRTIYNEINSFPDRSYSISELAQKGGLSVRTLQRRFKKQMGCSIQNLITTCLIGLARQLVQSTSLSITEIASLCYYKKIAIFSKTFKQQTGISPNEFRKSLPHTFTNTSNLTNHLKSVRYKGKKELSSIEKSILWLINEQRNISIQEIAHKMKISLSAAKKCIEALKKNKMLRRGGPRHGGYWIISQASGSAEK